MKKLLYAQMYPGGDRPGRLTALNFLIVIIIAASVVWAILETEPSLSEQWPLLFDRVDTVFGVFFLVEYLIRFWVVGLNRRFSGWRGRLRYVVTPFALLDLVVVLCFLSAYAGVSNAFILRLFRIFRIFALAKLGRLSEAIVNIGTALAARKFELLVSLAMAGIVLIFSATLMYIVEGPGQPTAFGSIPRALWWSISTLTTVGYGDVYPITPLGRVCAGITAISAVGLIAVPAGILAGAFAGIFKNKK